MQNGVFKIKLVFCEPHSYPALMGFMGFNCNPPLAEIINIPHAKDKTRICLLMCLKFSETQY